MSNSVQLHLAVDADATAAADAFDKVGQAARDMANQVDTAASDADSSMGGFSGSAEGAGSAASEAAGGFGDLGGALSAVPGPLGDIGGAMEKLAPLIMGVTGAADLLSLAQGTLNAIMAMNPFIAIAIALIAVIAGLIIAYKKSETFRDIIDKIGDVAKKVFSSIIDWIAKVVSWVKDKLGPVFEAFAGVVKTTIGNVVDVIKTMVDVVRDVATKVKDLFTAAWDKVKAAFQWNPVSTLRDAWSGIKDVLTAPFEKAWDVISGIFGKDGKIAGIGASAMNALAGAINAVIDAINEMIKIFNKLPGGDIPTIPHVGKSAAGATSSSRSVAGGAAGQVVTVNVYGAVDPYGTAQAIKRVLARGAIITGRATP